MATDEKRWGHVRIEPRLKRKLQWIAKRNRRTITAELGLALEQYKPLEDYPEEKEARDREAHPAPNEE